MGMQNNDIIFKKGDRVSCIGGGLHIECIVVEESKECNDVKVFDPVTGREIWISRNQIDHDKQYYRDKALKSLGI
jgi:hypothetical protein